tara:strand:- start:7139 stop:7372 length:234 start_codon:yes stop_codon:yes gene_type:complete
MTTKDEIMLIKHRIDKMEERLEDIDSKLDHLMERLLDPDDGVTARVNQNTHARKTLTRALWVLYGIVLGAMVKLFLK